MAGPQSPRHLVAAGDVREHSSMPDNRYSGARQVPAATARPADPPDELTPAHDRDGTQVTWDNGAGPLHYGHRPQR